MGKKIKWRGDEREFFSAWRYIKPGLIYTWQKKCKHPISDHDWCQDCRNKMNDFISKMFD